MLNWEEKPFNREQKVWLRFGDKQPREGDHIGYYMGINTKLTGRLEADEKNVLRYKKYEEPMYFYLNNSELHILPSEIVLFLKLPDIK